MPRGNKFSQKFVFQYSFSARLTKTFQENTYNDLWFWTLTIGATSQNEAFLCQKVE
jgi:hypothetical protein